MSECYCEENQYVLKGMCECEEDCECECDVCDCEGEWSLDLEEEQYKYAINLLEALEDDDDVQNVYTNAKL